MVRVTEFSVRQLSPDGRMSWCKSCMHDYHEQRKGSALRSPRLRLTDGRRAQVLALLEAGKPYDAIAAATGMSTGSVSRIRNRYQELTSRFEQGLLRLPSWWCADPTEGWHSKSQEGWRHVGKSTPERMSGDRGTEPGRGQAAR
jgi:hypothetical protein